MKVQERFDVLKKRKAPGTFTEQGKPSNVIAMICIGASVALVNSDQRLGNGDCFALCVRP